MRPEGSAGVLDRYTLIPGAFPMGANNVHPVGDTGFSGPAKQRAQQPQLNYVHTFSPNLVLEAKFAFSRFNVQSLPLNYGVDADDLLGIKNANVDLNSSGLSGITASGYRGLGDSGYIPLITINNMYQEVVNVTWVRGSHSIKIGGDLRRRQLTPLQSASPKAAFSFDANLTNDPSGATSGSGNSIASMLLGYPASTTRNKYLIWPGLRLWQMAGYLQDDWRATNWLTLNLGLRWDYYSPITEVANRISNVDLAAGKIIIAGQNGVSVSAGVKPDRRDFAPRIGFAATFAKGTVLRGGYGINYVPPFIGSPLAFRNPPFVTLYTVTATALNPITKISDPLPSAIATDPVNPTGSLNGVSLGGTTPYVQQYNLTLRRELPFSFVTTATYAGALGRHQYIFNGAVNMNQPAPGPGAINPRRPYYSLFPSVSGISIAGPWYNTSYHAMQTSLERRYQNGLSMLTTYTWAHACRRISKYRVLC